MTSLSTRILERADADLVGELLRDFTFPGEGFGCYSTFEVRDDARKWDQAQRVHWWRWFGYCDDEEWEMSAEEAAELGEGYSYVLDGYHVDVCWYWDGDGTLTFAVSDPEKALLRRLYNGDCKKDYRWVDVTDDTGVRS